MGFTDLFEHMLNEYRKQIPAATSDELEQFVKFAREQLAANPPVATEILTKDIALRFADGSVLTLCPPRTTGDVGQSVPI